MPQVSRFDDLCFPSGNKVRQVKKDARRLCKQYGLKHSHALDQLARDNGIDKFWHQALQELPRLAINRTLFTQSKLDAAGRPGGVRFTG